MTRGLQGPRRDRHYSYNEGVDEPGQLLDDEPVEIEAEVPADENEPEQRVDEGGRAGSPLEED
jgi:hypothetical protein